MAQDVNGKVLKVGDKVKAITNGGFGDYIKVGGIYYVTSVRGCSNGLGAHIDDDLYMCADEIELVEGDMVKGDSMCEPELTPKLIESLDELQVGDYFKDNEGVVRRVKVKDDSFTPIKTECNYYYNLAQLIYMGSYKVKVEPLEMVEVKEGVLEDKTKLYELVEGEDYVKLEIGDVVKFADGNTHKVHAVDEDDNVSPYCMQFIGEAWWVEAHYFLPENIISINGVNIHEEYVGDTEITADPYEGWVEGAKVKCRLRVLGYEAGGVYTLGWCASDYADNDFGVKTESGIVFAKGCLSSDDKQFINGDILDYFELIKE